MYRGQQTNPSEGNGRISTSRMKVVRERGRGKASTVLCSIRSEMRATPAKASAKLDKMAAASLRLPKSSRKQARRTQHKTAGGIGPISGSFVLLYGFFLII